MAALDNIVISLLVIGATALSVWIFIRIVGEIKFYQKHKWNMGIEHPSYLFMYEEMKDFYTFLKPGQIRFVILIFYELGCLVVLFGIFDSA